MSWENNKIITYRFIGFLKFIIYNDILTHNTLIYLENISCFSLLRIATAKVTKNN